MNVTKFVDYILIYLLIAFSGIPFFYRASIVFLGAFFLLPLCVFIYRKRKVDKFIVAYMFFAMFIQFLQMLKFSFLPISTFMGLHLRILFAYLVFKCVGFRSLEYYINVLFVSTIISLVFYVLLYVPVFESIMVRKVSPLFDNPLITSRTYKLWPSIIIYTFNTEGEGLSLLKRNSGPFWEPGAFAGFLTLAILFQIIRAGSFKNRKGKVLMLGLLSTFSTTGLIVLFFIIASYFYIKLKLMARMIYIPVVLIGFIIAFQSFDFLGAKITRKMSYDASTYNTRFKSAALDLIDFADNPWVGVGRSSTTRYKGPVDPRSNHRNNGVTNILAMYGFFFFFAYFFLIYLGFRRYCSIYGMNNYFAVFCLLAVFAIGFSEIYFNKVLFIGLTMLYYIYEPYSYKEFTALKRED